MKIREALASFQGGRRWTQGTLWARGADRFCAIGALVGEKLRMEHDLHSHDAYEKASLLPQVNILADVIREQYPEGHYITATGRVIPDEDVVMYFNDDLMTTFEDVERVFEKGAALEEEGL